MSYRENYFCAEGRSHYNEDDMCNYYPQYARGLALNPPTFINYKIVEKIDEKGLEDYISSLVDEKIDKVKQLVYKNLKEDLSLSIEEATRLAFAELGIISDEEIDTITQN